MEEPIADRDNEFVFNSDSSLIRFAYEDLRNLARRKIAGEGPQTLSATALVHEAWLRISRNGTLPASEWKNRRHFFGAAAEAMRRILIDRGRARNAVRRGREHEQVDVAISQIYAPVDETENTVELCEALEKFEKVDPECAEMVKLKYFVGLSWEEVAELTGESTRTVNRRWNYAKAWLCDSIETSRESDR